MWFELLSSTDGKHLGTSVSVLFSILIKWLVSLNGYSGKGIEPMHGDFEAQRHWLEITYHLPPSQWYRYDLPYWGLDYPPLTAYHSYVLGAIAHAINPSWVALDESRGREGEDLQLFMRTTALVTDLLVFSTGAVAFAAAYYPASWVSKIRYNAAMLGLTLWAVTCFLRGRYVLGGVFFTLALNFKQMALYLALPIFFYLLGQCFRRGPSLFIQLGVVVAATFTVCFLPFLGSLDDVKQVFVRVFPVHRGLYEDKVANFWCAINVVVKLRNMFDLDGLVKISIMMTLAAVLPSGFHVMLNPSPKRLLYALTNGALGFFLFSFQVHEKSILLATIPATLLIVEEPACVRLLTNVAMFSLFPLLKREKLAIPFAATWGIFNLISRSVLKTTSPSVLFTMVEGKKQKIT
ncbi:Glucosyltransferase-like protein [Irineochytrium annulatum]|nr:Glucosyltransferase-like protein [Irineochytrium annulatum]